jgi:xylulokinase
MARFFPHESSGRLFLDSAGPKLMNPEDLGRAVLEAMGFLVRSALSELADAGFPVTEMWVSGGQGKNPQWNQFKADLSGCALGIPELCDGELAGDAVTASVALGENAHRAEAVKRMIRLRARYAPLTETRAQYTEYYCLYRERQKTLEARWNQDGMV